MGILVPGGPQAWHPPASSPLSSSFLCAGSADPVELLGGVPGPVARPSYSRLWPPLEGGAWLKVMAGSLSARGLSSDPQCHLPHRLGEASLGLVLGSCLETLMNQSVNTWGFLASLAALPDTVSLTGKREAASSRVSMLSRANAFGLGSQFTDQHILQCFSPHFLLLRAFRSPTVRVSSAGPDLVLGELLVVGTSEFVGI